MFNDYELSYKYKKKIRIKSKFYLKDLFKEQGKIVWKIKKDWEVIMFKKFSFRLVLVILFLATFFIVSIGQVPPSGNPVAPPPSGPPVPGQAPSVPPPGAMVKVPQDVIEANLLKAIKTAKSLKSFLKPGKIWIVKGPAGDINIKGAIIYQNIVVGTVNFSPSNGNVLIQGYRLQYFNFSNNFSINIIREKYNSIVNKFEISNCAEFIAPEQCFAIPLVFENKIVTYLKIYIDGVHVMQDFAATQEMYMYGQAF